MSDSLQVHLAVDQIEKLIQVLRSRGYEVLGPTIRDGAVVHDTIESSRDLPQGQTDEQEAGRYRLKPREDGALFGYTVGPQSWKNHLYPAEVKLFEAEQKGGVFRILNNLPTPARPSALLGVRACDLAAIEVQDRVLLRGQYHDPIYEARRDGVFLVAVQCTQSAATCFCTSMGTGPRVPRAKADLTLTEVVHGGEHWFLAEAGGERGRDVLANLNQRPTTEEERRSADAAVETAARQQIRHMDTTGIRNLLYENFEHPRWDQVAERCLACTNCTLVCPTCFCANIEDVSDVTGERAERWRRWDSCFTMEHSYIHGGSVRSSGKSRYRQWMTHKLATWIDQFGSSGCVGCGRCITWCPVGIDITEELAAIRGDGKHGATDT
jgi:sulfhydrogenase subunit beta (sulfur reductase)